MKVLFARWRQGRRTLSFPPPMPALPARYRGRPVRAGADGSHAVVDLGALTFSPEDRVKLGGGDFGCDYAMATRKREHLLTSTGEVELATALDAEARRLLGRSLRLRSVAAGSCNGCEAELVALGNVVFDLARFGVQFVASPRHADGLVVTGAVSLNMQEALHKTYEAMPDPRVVIAVGSCALSGGPFSESPEVLGGVPPEIPIDLYIPGCPPHPLTIIDGILRLLGRLRSSDRVPAPRAPSGPRPKRPAEG